MTALHTSCDLADLAGFVVLHGTHSTIILETRPSEAPLWRYWGPRLPDGCQPDRALRATRPVPPSSMEFDQPLSLFPTFGNGWYGQSALLAHRGGRDFAHAIDACRVERQQSAAGAQATFHLNDTVAQIAVQIRVTLDAHDVLRLETQLENRGTEALDVTWLAAGTLPLPGDTAQVVSWIGQWANEFNEQCEPLSRSLWQRENRRGRTSHDTPPSALALLPGATEHAGVAYGAHLAWSGNHRQCIEWLHNDQYQWQLGEWLAPGECLLPPGARLNAPALLASCSPRGRNGLAQNFHAGARALVRWPTGQRRPRPVHINTWEACYFDHDETNLRDLASAAAALGVERFVLDDGWFHGRHHDRAGLGDWWPDAGKYPQGLNPLAEHVRSLGMEFGLWVEPEMVNPDSDLFRAHPDWALQVAGRPLLTMRNQLVLDVARLEVSAYLYERLAALLDATPIAYLKWDMNRDLTQAGDALGQPAYRGFVLALYALLDRLRQAYPAVEIEACASGGARADFGMLPFVHRYWTSDCNDAVSRMTIQRGALQFLPPELLGAHIGPAPAHTTGRQQLLDFRAAVMLPCHLGLELDIRKLADAERDTLRQWIALYKRLRDGLHGTTVWRGQAGDGIHWQAHGDADTRQVIVFVYRITPTDHRYTPALRLPFLDATVSYDVTLIRHDADETPYSPLTADRPNTEAVGEAPAIHGAWLAQRGLPLPRMWAESALILRLRVSE